jgi:hypothetical protein
MKLILPLKIQSPLFIGPFSDRWSVSLLFLICFVLSFLPHKTAFGKGAKTSAGKPSTFSSRSSDSCWSSLDNDPDAEHLEEAVEKFLGIPYRRGGETRRGTDCSGLMRQIYGDLFGIRMPHNSGGQSSLPFLTRIPRDELSPGDMIFFGPNKRRINHVGMYLSDGKFIHSSSRKGVTISSLDSRYWGSRFIVSKRVKGLQLAGKKGDSTNVSTFASLDRLNRMIQTLDVGYGQSFLDDSLYLNFGALFQVAPYVVDIEWPTLEYTSTTNQLTWRSLRDWDMAKGLRVSATIALSDWLWVSPSLSYLDIPSDRLGLESARQELGLGSTLTLPETRLSMFMSAGASTRESYASLSSTNSTDWNSYDVSFGLGYRVLDRLRVSVAASHAWDDNSSMMYNRYLLDRSKDNYLFRLDFSF